MYSYGRLTKSNCKNIEIDISLFVFYSYCVSALFVETTHDSISAWRPRSYSCMQKLIRSVSNMFFTKNCLFWLSWTKSAQFCFFFSIVSIPFNSFSGDLPGRWPSRAGARHLGTCLSQCNCLHRKTCLNPEIAKGMHADDVFSQGRWLQGANTSSSNNMFVGSDSA